ncbi:MAG: histidine kinase [Bacteroidaceae bacterium]|nr:histidine kinase [Bacteroidaceae bacterium]
MATVLKSKSFQKNLFFSIGGIFLVFAVCFSFYQYGREKDYKIDILHSRLQMYNYEMMQSLGEEGILNDSIFAAYTRTHGIERMRVTVINKHGEVLQDNNYKEVDSLSNHLERHEVKEALVKGNGYDIKRTSQSTHETYFYSATRFNKLIVRSAVPYSAELTESLQADSGYIYYAIALTLLLAIALYWNTRRISRHVGYLREFAVRADKGEELDRELERRLPDDELGEISHTIITLYWKLRHSEEDKVRMKRQLTQNAAHELKTPAASIHGYLESILDNPEMPAETRQHFLERCYAQSERMSRLLIDMAQLTHLDEIPVSSTEKTGRQSKTDLVPIIHNVLEDTALQLNKKGIHLIEELPKSIIIQSPLSSPEGILYSVFRNLVDNTLAHGSGATWIRIAYDNGEFTFADNGIGVPPEHLPYLFERFYRVDKGRSRKLGGTGLGLAIVKNAVAAHGGTTTALPTPEGGLTIKFTFNHV